MRENLLLPIFLLPVVLAQIKLCEVSGDCKLCPDRRYSYYRCGHQGGCFPTETCEAGFCCPIPKPLLALQNEKSSERFPTPPELPKTALSKDAEEKCPDGSDWTLLCTSDQHCPRNTLCAEGKCCTSCGRLRRKFLDDLGAKEIMGKAIPQCTDDGRLYRQKQCLAGTDNCWCVSSFGRRLYNGECVSRKPTPNLLAKAVKLRDELRTTKGKCLVDRIGTCPRIRPSSDAAAMSCRCDDDCYGQKKCCAIDGVTVCTTPVLPQAMTMVCGPNEQFSACHSPCQASCDDPTVPACPPPVCQPGCHCMPGYIRRDGSPRSICVPRATCVLFDVTSHCADERRQYQSCGSACPISCQTRNMPRCHERCVAGCFCRIPYVLENAADPLHSRCILPSECPLEQLPIVPKEVSRLPVPTQVYALPYAPNTATVLPNTNHCADPMKNYLSCGTKCPVGCNALKLATTCSLQCVPGCFCHAPYILLDANDPQSGCVLPQNCPRVSSEVIGSAATCTDPRKEWTSCGALNCARSCNNLLGLCGAGYCSPGCICREPYVLQDTNDPNSRCVLPSECSRKCEDTNKEFLTCGSSCPVGCDNRHPRSCTPCQAGCFCRNGLVALNSSSWQTSECLRFEDCPTFFEETTTTTTTTTESTTTSTTTLAPTEAFKKDEVDTSNSLFSVSDECPSTTLDVGGRTCNRDTDCPTEQRCCRALIASLGVSPQRCACKDPLAVWSSCGSLCPEYCGQPAVPVCSATCNPGCQCAAGYVRARNDVTAPCIPREACPHVPSAVSLDAPKATIKEIVEEAPSDPFSRMMVAVANLRGTTVKGRFTFTQFSRTTLNIGGSVEGLEPGAHAVVLHQFGDVSNDCLRIGPPFLFRRSNDTPSLGDINGVMAGASKFSRTVDWPVGDVIGRSIAVYRFSTAEWKTKAQLERPIACATIGVANL